MVTRAEIIAQLEALRRQLDACPTQCESCGAPLKSPLVGETCEYCGRVADLRSAVAELDEPSDIRKTNASTDICQMCGLVHSTDPAAPVICRCLYCGQIAPVAMSTTDAQLGSGVVCRQCCGGAGPRNFQQMEAEALARAAAAQPKMPWQ